MQPMPNGAIDFASDLCVVDGPTEVKVGMYINDISRHGEASFQTVVCLYHSKQVLTTFYTAKQ